MTQITHSFSTEQLNQQLWLFAKTVITIKQWD